MDIYGPVELNLELNSQTPYVANKPVLNFVYLARKFVS